MPRAPPSSRQLHLLVAPDMMPHWITRARVEMDPQGSRVKGVVQTDFARGTDQAAGFRLVSFVCALHGRNENLMTLSVGGLLLSVLQLRQAVCQPGFLYLIKWGSSFM